MKAEKSLLTVTWWQNWNFGFKWMDVVGQYRYLKSKLVSGILWMINEVFVKISFSLCISFFFEIFRFCQSIRDTLLEFKPRITEFWAISGWQKSSSIHNHTLRDVTSIIFPQKKTNDLSLTDVLDKKYIPFSFWIIAGWTGITFLWLSYIFHISPSTF